MRRHVLAKARRWWDPGHLLDEMSRAGSRKDVMKVSFSCILVYSTCSHYCEYYAPKLDSDTSRDKLSDSQISIIFTIVTTSSIHKNAQERYFSRHGGVV